MMGFVIPLEETVVKKPFFFGKSVVELATLVRAIAGVVSASRRLHPAR